MAKYRQLHAAVPADPVPEPAAAQPHVRPGDGDVRSADAARASSSSRAATRPKTSSGRSGRRRISVLVCVPKILEVLKRSRDPRLHPETASEPPRKMHWVAALVALPARPSGVRLKFWAMVVGAAPLDPDARSVLGAARLRRRAGLRADRNRADRHAESSAPRRQGRGRQADRRRRGEDRRRRRDPGARRQRHARLLQRAGGDAGRVPGRLVPHRRHRRARRQGSAPHPRPQEGDDRHAGGTERLSGGRRAGAQRAAGRQGFGGRRRGAAGIDGRARPRHPRRWSRRRIVDDDRPAARTLSSPITRRSARRPSGPEASCRAPKARAS